VQGAGDETWLLLRCEFCEFSQCFLQESGN
jgi:hypothetical protein